MFIAVCELLILRVLGACAGGQYEHAAVRDADGHWGDVGISDGRLAGLTRRKDKRGRTEECVE